MWHPQRVPQPAWDVHVRLPSRLREALRRGHAVRRRRRVRRPPVRASTPTGPTAACVRPGSPLRTAPARIATSVSVWATAAATPRRSASMNQAGCGACARAARSERLPPGQRVRGHPNHLRTLRDVHGHPLDYVCDCHPDAFSPPSLRDAHEDLCRVDALTARRQLKLLRRLPRIDLSSAAGGGGEGYGESTIPRDDNLISVAQWCTVLACRTMLRVQHEFACLPNKLRGRHSDVDPTRHARIRILLKRGMKVG